MPGKLLATVPHIDQLICDIFGITESMRGKLSLSALKFILDNSNILEADVINEERLREKVEQTAKEMNMSFEAAYVYVTGDDVAKNAAKSMNATMKELQDGRSDEEATKIAALKKRYYEGIKSGNSLRIHEAMGIKAQLMKDYNIHVGPNDLQD